MSKLGLHFQLLPSWHRLHRVPWVKAIEPPAENPWPWAQVIGRVWVGGDHVEQQLIWQGVRGAQEYHQLCSEAYRRAPYTHAWEGPNEPHPLSDANFRRALRVFTIEWVRLMRAAALRTIVGCFSVEWPAAGTAAEFSDMLAQADYFGLREYGAPAMWTREGEHCLRYRRTIAELQAARARVPPIIIGECGIDGGVLGESGRRKGWRTYATRGQYQEQLAWYDARLQEDPLVWCATPFVSGPEATWRDFDYDEDLARWTAARHTTLNRPPPISWIPAAAPSSPTSAPRPPTSTAAPRSPSSSAAIPPPVAVPAPARLQGYAGIHWATIGAFAEWMRANRPDIRRVVLHHTYKPTPATWQGRRTLDAMERVYRQRGWRVGPALFIAPDGIWGMHLPGTLNRGAGRNSVVGLPDGTAIGESRFILNIETVGDYRQTPPTGTIRELLVGVLAAILSQGKPDIRYHSLYMATECPGAAFVTELPAMQRDAEALATSLQLPQPWFPGLPEHETATDLATLASKVRVWLEEEVRLRKAGRADRADEVRDSLIVLALRVENIARGGS